MPATNRNLEAASNFRRVLASGTLTGDRVFNMAGDELGRIEEIVVDIPSGKIAYAVLAFGGLFGVGNKLFAIPWTALTLDQAQNCFFVDLSRAELDALPGFDRNNWPDISLAPSPVQDYRYNDPALPVYV